MHTPEERVAFWRVMLGAMGIEKFTPWRKAFLDEWARFENTGAKHNPLATTKPGFEDPADPHWNDNGGNPVRNYVSLDAGARQTAKTITNSLYPAIVAALHEQVLTGRAVSVAAQLRTWGTVGFSDAIAGGWKPTVDPVWTHRPLANWDNFPITGVFGDTTPPTWSSTNPHMGVDIGVPEGHEYFAPADGKVVAFTNNGSFGNGVCLDIVGTPFYLLGAHLKSTAVAPGRDVTAGTLLGITGATGFVSGAHLHLQLSLDTQFARDLSRNRDFLKYIGWNQTPDPQPNPAGDFETRLRLLEIGHELMLKSLGGPEVYQYDLLKSIRNDQVALATLASALKITLGDLLERLNQ